MRLIARSLLALALLSAAAFPSVAAINGTVMTTEGLPISGARVSIHAIESVEARRTRLLSASPEMATIAATQTDARGSFSLASPKEAVVDLAVQATGYQPVLRRVEREDETGAIALLKSETRRGTVTAAGKPVAGATVVINLNGFEYVTRTGDDGRYETPDPKSARTIAVLHPDFAIDEENLSLSGSSQTRLNRSLVRGSSLEGRVVASDGKTPVANAGIVLDGWPVATSGEDGSFKIAHAPLKWLTLTARKDALVGQRSFSKGQLVIRLDKGATISGRVLDSKSKLPVAGAQVRAYVQGTGFRIGFAETAGSALTDAKGSYSFIVPPASYLLMASHPAYDNNQLDASVAAGQAVPKDVQLHPLARVTGIVVDEARKPVAAAVISSENDADPMRGFTMLRAGATPDVASGPDGKFTIRLSGDTELRLKASRKGLPPARTDTLKLAPGERKSGVVLTIPMGVEVTGRVTNAEGQPLSGVAVTALQAESGRGGMQRIVLSALGQNEDDAVRTGSDGSFSLRLKEGSYDFSFKREGYAPQSVRAQNVTTAGPNTVEAKLEIAAEIQGRVVRNGTGVPGVMAFAMMMGSDARAVTGPDGSFTLGGLPAGVTRINFRKDDEFIQEVRNLKAPSSDVLIEIPPGGRITGRVIEKGTNKAVTQFQAGLSRSRSGGGMMMMAPPQLQSFTSEDGTFALENVPTGAHDLIASAPGYAGGRTNVTVEEGKTLEDVVIELDTGTRLTGRVTGPTGTPLSDVRVSLAMGMTGAFARTMTEKRTETDANGEYTLDGLQAGNETIEFQHPKYVGTRKDVTLKGREMRLDAQLGGGQRVTGTVVTESGAPVADAEVRAGSSGGSWRSARTNASGAFELDSLAPARYRFSASKQGFAEGVVEDVDIAAGAPVQITLRTGGTLYGRVTGLSAEELSSAAVDVRSGRNSASASVDPNGNYRLEGAPVGTVSVSASVMSRSMTGRRTSSTKTVELEAGSTRQVDLEFLSDTVIQGRVTRNGVPLKTANVSFTPLAGGSQTSAGASTDEEGRYSVSGLESGEYSVTVMDMQRFSPYSTKYEVRGSGTFDIDYRANALRGRVLDGTSNAPIEGATVELRNTNPTTAFRGMFPAQTDSNGGFVFDAVAAGSYTVNAAKEGYGHQTLNLPIGDRPPDDVELKLWRSDGVALKVIDARSGNLLNAIVAVYDAQGRVVHEPRMIMFGGSDGGAEVKLALSPGTYTASVSSMNYAPRTVSWQAPSSQTVALTPGGSIHIRSRHSAPARVRLLDASGMQYPRFSRVPYVDLLPSPGTTKLDFIAPGTYTLQLLGANDAVLDAMRVEVREGQTVGAEI